MLVKNEYDRQGLLAIGKIVAEILGALSRHAKPGVSTRDLDDHARDLLAAAGAESTPAKEYRFPGRLCISVNDEVVHGIPGERVLREGDLVKLDLTADKHGFVADATRMVLLEPAGGVAECLAACATRACRAAIALARPGMELSKLGAAIHKIVSDSGFSVVKDLCGHGVGRHTHEEPEVPNFADRSNRDRLKKGSVITIEPIINAGRGGVRSLADGWTIVTADRSLSAHYEETIIVGDDGGEIVTVSPQTASA